MRIVFPHQFTRGEIRERLDKAQHLTDLRSVWATDALLLSDIEAQWWVALRGVAYANEVFKEYPQRLRTLSVHDQSKCASLFAILRVVNCFMFRCPYGHGSMGSHPNREANASRSSCQFAPCLAAGFCCMTDAVLGYLWFAQAHCHARVYC